MVIYLQARPSIDSAIILLRWSEFRGFPVSKLLSLGNFSTKEDGINLLERMWLEAI